MEKTWFYFLWFLLPFYSCVSPKIHNDLLSKYESLQGEYSNKEHENLKLSEQIEEQNTIISLLKNQIKNLRNDSIQNGSKLQVLQNKHEELNKAYDLLLSKSSREMANKAKSMKKLLNELEISQNKLFAKEEELNKLSQELKQKELELNESQQALEKRSIRVAELEFIIHQKDSLVSSLKTRVSQALTGLEGNGLTIEKRNGKIYISLEEDLLFASGQYNVNKMGENALKKLAVVLSNQQKIDILVEGHTDNIPIKESKLVRDNWDLSVMRATSVVKILLKNEKLDPLQLTAAGKGKYSPIANNETKEGRKMNRRIEMILSPNLNDLFDLLKE